MLQELRRAIIPLEEPYEVVGNTVLVGGDEIAGVVLNVAVVMADRETGTARLRETAAEKRSRRSMFP